MADEADNAQESIELAMRHSLAYRRPIATKCECGEPSMVTQSGRARFCEPHLADFQAGLL
jgi:hypothetical protein